jgi:hypothetical protein
MLTVLFQKGWCRMFLYKKYGIYHFYYRDDSGKRRSRTTGATTKSAALEFGRAYNAEEDARRRALQHITFDEFMQPDVQALKDLGGSGTIEKPALASEKFLGPPFHQSIAERQSGTSSVKGGVSSRRSWERSGERLHAKHCLSLRSARY